MPRVPHFQVSQLWLEALQAVFGDVVELGHGFKILRNRISLNINIPFARSGPHARVLWGPARQQLHQRTLLPHAGWIRAFERQNRNLFITGRELALDRIKPALVVVDFSDSEQTAITTYLQRYQTISSRKLVGRRMGLLVYDVGQRGFRPLIGGALLCSARYYQPARDSYLHWPKRVLDSGGVRQLGLSRIMQLSTVCALPPYSQLSASWMLAGLPFTDEAQSCFAAATRNEPDPDLAAVVATTSMDLSGSPFRAHSVAQLFGDGHRAHGAASDGHIYHRIETLNPPRASFERLLSDKTLEILCKLHEDETRELKPMKDAVTRTDKRRKKRSDSDVLNPDSRVCQSALSLFLKRLGLNRSFFDGNDMGVHIGAVGSGTLEALRTGAPRVHRPRVKLDGIFAAWQSRFALRPAVHVRTSARDAEHQRKATAKRRAATKAIRIRDILLSNHLE